MASIKQFIWWKWKYEGVIYMYAQFPTKEIRKNIKLEGWVPLFDKWVLKKNKSLSYWGLNAKKDISKENIIFKQQNRV